MLSTGQGRPVISLQNSKGVFAAQWLIQPSVTFSVELPADRHNDSLITQKPVIINPYQELLDLHHSLSSLDKRYFTIEPNPSGVYIPVTVSGSQSKPTSPLTTSISKTAELTSTSVTTPTPAPPEKEIVAEERLLHDLPYSVPSGWNQSEVFRHLPLPPEQVILDRDDFIKADLTDPDKSLDWYYKETAKRKAIESEGGEYAFEPLTTTLQNMQKLTTHILEDRQFDTPLTTAEKTVFQQIQDNIGNLMQMPKPPYKRTVVLTLKFTVLYDYLVTHKVLKRLPGFARDWDNIDWRYNMIHIPALTAIDSIHELNDLPVTPEALSDSNVLPDWLATQLSKYKVQARLNDPDCFFYPTFEPLDLEHFVGFGHLPVFPLGIMDAYSARADGRLQSPLAFYQHDLFHANHSFSSPGDHEKLLASPESRMNFRKAVLGPGQLSDGIRKSAIMILFRFFHEISYQSTLRDLSGGSYLNILKELLYDTRIHLDYFSTQYHGLSEQDKIMAAQWVYLIWNQSWGKPLNQVDIEYLYQTEILSNEESVRVFLATIQEHKSNLIPYLDVDRPFISLHLLFRKDSGTGRPALDCLDYRIIYLLHSGYDWHFRHSLAFDLGITLPQWPFNTNSTF